jgi:hypothetical protein
MTVVIHDPKDCYLFSVSFRSDYQRAVPLAFNVYDPHIDILSVIHASLSMFRNTTPMSQRVSRFSGKVIAGISLTQTFEFLCRRWANNSNKFVVRLERPGSYHGTIALATDHMVEK